LLAAVAITFVPALPVLLAAPAFLFGDDLAALIGVHAWHWSLRLLYWPALIGVSLFTTGVACYWLWIRLTQGRAKK
jgi:hypothetical protein